MGVVLQAKWRMNCPLSQETLHQLCMCVCVYTWISVTVLLWLSIIESTIVNGELKYFEFA